MLVKVKKLHEDAILPARMTPGSAGFDLYAYVKDIPNTNINAIQIRSLGGVELIPTGIALQLPPGYEAQIRPRSGLAMKHAVTVLNSPATIDSDYRGEIKVLLINHGTNSFQVTNGMRIAQLVIAKYQTLDFEEVKELENTERDSNGFGSTGIK